MRAAEDRDSAGVIDLIARVFDEYPGCVLDVDLEEPELRAPRSSFDRFWVLETRASGTHRGAIVGCVGLGLPKPAALPDSAALHHDDGKLAELKKLYLDRAWRGRRLGAQLVAVVEDEARAAGAAVLELWTDTRFVTAHAVYERLGYRRSGAERELRDLSHTTEFHFTKRL